MADAYANVTSPSSTDLYIQQRARVLKQEDHNKKVRLGNWKKQMRDLGYTVRGNKAYDGSGSVRHSFDQYLRGEEPSVIKQVQAPSQRSDYSDVDLSKNQKLKIPSVLPQPKYNQYGIVTNQEELNQYGLGNTDGGIDMETAGAFGLEVGTTNAGAGYTETPYVTANRARENAQGQQAGANATVQPSVTSQFEDDSAIIRAARRQSGSKGSVGKNLLRIRELNKKKKKGG